MIRSEYGATGAREAKSNPFCRLKGGNQGKKQRIAKAKNGVVKFYSKHALMNAPA
jgi:hypothetical protein